MIVLNMTPFDMLSFKLVSKQCYAATKDFDGTSLIRFTRPRWSYTRRHTSFSHSSGHERYWSIIKQMRTIEGDWHSDQLDSLFCFRCFKVQASSSFPDSERPKNKKWRCCLECGLQTKKWYLKPITFDGIEYHSCGKCHHIHKASKLNALPPRLVINADKWQICDHCLAEANKERCRSCGIEGQIKDFYPIPTFIRKTRGWLCAICASGIEAYAARSAGTTTAPTLDAIVDKVVNATTPFVSIARSVVPGNSKPFFKVSNAAIEKAVEPAQAYRDLKQRELEAAQKPKRKERRKSSWPVKAEPADI